MMEYIYELPPTDFFGGFKNVKEIKNDECYDYLGGIIPKVERAKYLFNKYTCWEGDGEFYVSAIPSGNSEPLLLITTKQSNNGTTFLVSPIRLEHLEEWLEWRIQEEVVYKVSY